MDTNYNRKDIIGRLNEIEKEAKSLRKILNEIQVKENITDRVKTFQDACSLVVITPDMQNLLDYKGTDPDMLSSQAHMKLTIIARALNEGWKPDWSDSSQTKYTIWPKFDAGVGFSDCDYAYSVTTTDVGSRLCYKSEELAKYAFNQFNDIYCHLLI